MSDDDTIRARRLPDGTVVQVFADGTTRPLEDHTDWRRLAAMTEAEIEANALADADNPPMTEAALSRMRRVPNPKAIRGRLRLTQEQFADRFRLPLGTVRDWELGRRRPDRAAENLLLVIDKNPEAVIRALDAAAPHDRTEG